MPKRFLKDLQNLLVKSKERFIVTDYGKQPEYLPTRQGRNYVKLLELKLIAETNETERLWEAESNIK